MANTYPKILLAGTQAAYDALQAKDENKLYFCTDSGKIYKGTVDFSNSVVFAAAKPEKPVVGKVYVLADTNTVEVYNGTAWTVVSYPTATTISEASTNVQVASAKAVFDFVTEKIAEVTGGANVVTAVAEGTEAGTFTYTTGDSKSHTVTLNGLAKKPTWNTTTRTLTIPVVGGDDVVVEIGKDIFVDPEGDNSYHADTKEIWLTLNDTKKSVIKIPAAGLVDIYTGGKTKSVQVAVSDGKVVSADVIVRPDVADGDEAFTNALKIGETGLYVDLSAYATTASLEAAKTELNKSITAVKTTADANKSTLDTLTADETSSGSIKQQIKAEADARTAADGALDTRVKALETDNTANKAAIKENSDNIAALASSFTWGTFE